MKTGIHPQYYKDAKVSCSCGNHFTTGSTKENITVEICYKCHPLYTGKHRLVDAKGRAGIFQKKQEAAKQYQTKYGSKKQRTQTKDEHQPKTLRELLGEV